MPFSGPRTTALHALSLAVVAAVIAATCAGLIHREHALRRSHAGHVVASLSLLTITEVERLVVNGWPAEVRPGDQQKDHRPARRADSAKYDL